MRLSTWIRGLVPALALATPLTAAAQGELVLYCTVQEEWCRPMVAAFEKATGIKVLMTRKSSGEFYAQLKAEAANPRGDIWWGGTGDPHLQAAEEGLTEPYKSPQHGRAAGLGGPPVGASKGRTVGVYAGALGYSYNRDQLKKKNIAEPKCWADLTEAAVQGRDPGREPELVGHVVHDAGDARAADGRGQGVRLHEGDAQERQPVHEVGRGAGARGGHRRKPGRHHVPARRRRAGVGGAPVKIVSPCEGTGYEIGSMSIVKGAKNMENAKKWYDWALSPEAQAIGAQNKVSYQVPSNKSAPVPAQAPKLAEIKLINYDFVKYGSSAERKRLLDKWDKEVSTLPK